MSLRFAILSGLLLVAAADASAGEPVPPEQLPEQLKRENADLNDGAQIIGATKESDGETAIYKVNKKWQPVHQLLHVGRSLDERPLCPEARRDS